METAADRKLPYPWVALALALVALLAVYLAYDRAGLGQLFSADEADMRADIEKALDDYKTYQTIKELYPKAYEELIHLIADDMRRGTDLTAAIIEGAEFTTKLRRDNAQYFGMASIDHLRLSLNGQVSQYDYLKKAYGFRTCNTLAAHGGVAIARLLGSDFLKDHTLLQLMDETTGYFFRTAAEGRRLKLQHEKPTAADWRDTGDYLKSKGMTDASIKLVSEPAKNLDDPQLCDAIMKFYQTVTTMDRDAAKRVVPYLAATAAAG